MSSLKSIRTEKVSFNNLKATAKGRVKLVPDKLLSYNVNEIQYTIPVEKFTEGTVEADVHPINVKEGFALKTFPDKVTVRYQVALSKYNSVDKSMFDATVDATNIESLKGNKLDVKLVTFPSFVRVTILEPEKVDYILRKQ
jgi:YbbR domain-containing protein